MAEHHGDPVRHHADHAAAATGLKKKIGPLPMWAWVAIVGGTILIVMVMRRGSSTSKSGDTVDPDNPMGLTYSQEQADMEQGVDPTTGQSYASEQSAADSTQGGALDTGGGDAGSGDTSGTDSDGELTAIDSDLQGLQSAIAAQPADDGQTPEGTFAGELGDVADGITALQALQATLAPTPPTAADPSPGPAAPASPTPSQPSHRSKAELVVPKTAANRTGGAGFARMTNNEARTARAHQNAKEQGKQTARNAGKQQRAKAAGAAKARAEAKEATKQRAVAEQHHHAPARPVTLHGKQRRR